MECRKCVRQNFSPPSPEKAPSNWFLDWPRNILYIYIYTFLVKVQCWCPALEKSYLGKPWSSLNINVQYWCARHQSTITNTGLGSPSLIEKSCWIQYYLMKAQFAKHFPLPVTRRIVYVCWELFLGWASSKSWDARLGWATQMLSPLQGIFPVLGAKCERIIWALTTIIYPFLRILW